MEAKKISLIMDDVLFDRPYKCENQEELDLVQKIKNGKSSQMKKEMEKFFDSLDEIGGR